MSPTPRNVARFEWILDTMALAGARQPGADPQVYGLQVERDVAYVDDGHPDHVLDIYKPADRRGPLPVVLYVHGGGFRLLSKDTHWMMAVAFARRGYLVLNLNYRLAPAHPFPAALEDVSAAWLWALQNVARLGGDPERIVLAGESAGANLVTSLAIETAWRREEPWARPVFEAGVRPAAVVGYCGIYEVSGIERLLTGPEAGLSRWLPEVVRSWVLGIERSYLWEVQGPTDLADPLRVLEAATASDRPLPPFFLSVGDRDPLVDDSVRLSRALDRLGVRNSLRIYGGQSHAFQMMTWQPTTRRSWQDTFAFLTRNAPQARPVPRLELVDGGRAERLGRWAREKVIDLVAA